MAGSNEALHEIAERLEDALGTGDLAALGELLADDVTWGDCAGRDEMLRFVDRAVARGTHIGDVEVEPLEDRLVVTMRLGDDGPGGLAHQAVFVENGMIQEICDAADREQARTVRPIGALAVAAARACRLDDVASVLPVRELGAAIDHYRRLGFDVRAYDGEAQYAFATRDAISFHLAQVGELDPAANTSAVYLYVSDADSLFARWRSSGVEGRLVAPVDAEYGLREGAHVDPDGNLIRFGSPLS